MRAHTHWMYFFTLSERRKLKMSMKSDGSRWHQEHSQNRPRWIGHTYLSWSLAGDFYTLQHLPPLHTVRESCFPMCSRRLPTTGWVLRVLRNTDIHSPPLTVTYSFWSKRWKYLKSRTKTTFKNTVIILYAQKRVQTGINMCNLNMFSHNLSLPHTVTYGFFKKSVKILHFTHKNRFKQE